MAVVGTEEQRGAVVVLGGRGMGKSVFLQQICAALETEGELRVVVLPVPPPELTVRACLYKLSDALGVAGGALDSRKILGAYFARDGVPDRLVLLFDEFDSLRRPTEGQPIGPRGAV